RHRQPGAHRRLDAGRARRLSRRGRAERYRGRSAGAVRRGGPGHQRRGQQADHRPEPPASQFPAAAPDARHRPVARRRSAPGGRVGRERAAGRPGP
ncbi:hypothetical protein LTR94_036453, partial [Friedmanniomyces endolithicus]